MIPRLQEVYPLVANSVNQAVLLSNAPGPATRQQVSQRLRSAYACEWIAQRRFNQIENPKRGIPLRLDPIAKIVAKFLMEDCLALNWPAQLESPGAVDPRFRACFSQVLPAAVRSAGAGRSWGSGADGPSPADRPVR